MTKWEKGQPFKRRKKRHPKSNNSYIGQDEHDKIYRAYHDGTMTQTELAHRFGRSIGAICRIVNGQHPLYPTKK